MFPILENYSQERREHLWNVSRRDPLYIFTLCTLRCVISTTISNAHHIEAIWPADVSCYESVTRRNNIFIAVMSCHHFGSTFVDGKGA